MSATQEAPIKLSPFDAAQSVMKHILSSKGDVRYALQLRHAYKDVFFPETNDPVIAETLAHTWLNQIF